MKRIAFALFSTALLAGLGASGVAEANGSGQVVFTNSVSGLAGQGAGTFTYGGATVDAQIGFSIHCALSTSQCKGAFYVAPISVTSHGQALTIFVSGTLTEVSPGVYTIALSSPAPVAGCTLTNSGVPAPEGATPTQSVTVACSGNGTTTLLGSGTATGIVNVTHP